MSSSLGMADSPGPEPKDIELQSFLGGEEEIDLEEDMKRPVARQMSYIGIPRIHNPDKNMPSSPTPSSALSVQMPEVSAQGLQLFYKRNRHGIIAFCVASFFFLVVILAVTTAPSDKTNNIPIPIIPGVGCVRNATLPYRLPSGVTRPLAYELQLRPDLDTLGFDGNVDIQLVVSQSTTCIVLHASQLTISSVLLLPNGGNVPFRTSSVTMEEGENQFLVVDFGRELPQDNNMTLSIAFNGTMNNDMVGFYRSTYTDDNGQVQSLASTQFESTFARRAFPCFDEPALKATFRLTTTTRIRSTSSASAAPLTVLFNTPIESTQIMSDNEFIVTRFQQTPPMSTYLVAFVYGQLDYIAAESRDIPYRVYTTPGNSASGAFALEVAQRVVPFLSDFFSQQYMMPKLDLIGIPDFSAGAMENIGLITFRDEDLLVNADSSLLEKMYVALVVTHEIAHQWTGDLVTMGWWNELWLNEGFATFFEYFTVDALYPEFNIQELLLTMTREHALDADARSSTHPVVNNEVTSRAEIEALFDYITYDKGGQLLTMLRSYADSVTPDGFRYSLRYYFDRFKFSNAFTSPDLWSAFAAVTYDSDLSFKMEDWVSQPGYPLLTFQADPISSGSYMVRQSRFFASPSAKNASLMAAAAEELSVNEAWWIPLTVIYGGNAVTTRSLSLQLSAETTFDTSIPVPDGVTWLLANPDATGFFRANYPTQVWQSLSATISAGMMTSVRQRYVLISDALALLQGTLLDAPTALNLAQSTLYKERSYAVWTAALPKLSLIHDLLGGLPGDRTALSNWNIFVSDLLRNTTTFLGWETTVGEPALNTLLRPLLLSASVQAGDAGVASKAAEMMATYLADRTKIIDPELRDIVYGSYVANGGTAAYDTVYQLFLSETSSTEKLRWLRALSAATDRTLLSRTLTLAIGPLVRAQDSWIVVRWVSRNPYGTQLAWNFFKTNFNLFNDRYGMSSVIASLITGLTNRFSGDAAYNNVQTFFNTHQAPSGVAAVASALENINSNTQWISANLVPMSSFLTSYVGTRPT